ncbi:glycosyltransferase family 4 protein [Patescibacteria group bacterium]|nr:glycosyltransferase family 4 protein [Patescibacteria group bacterium]
MAVLFITRKYPPQTGGMESFSYGLINHYKGEKHVIALKKSQINLIWFYPYALLKAIGVIWTKKIDLVHLSDGVMTPLGHILKIICGRPVVFTAHGLDINFNHFLYRKLMPLFFRQMTHIFCVSNATRLECIKTGVNETKISIIPNAVEPREWPQNLSKNEARERLSQNFNCRDVKIVLSVGRLARRKGFRWFIENVMTKLPEEYIYLIIGAGRETKGFFAQPVSQNDLLEQAVRTYRLTDRVHFLGKVLPQALIDAYAAADIFVMPNIIIKGDMEGFGIVALEAGMMGTPVLAANIEGIRDAVIDGTTGLLAESQNAEDFIAKLALLEKLNLSPQDIRATVIEKFSWEKISKRYKDAFEKLQCK